MMAKALPLVAALLLSPCLVSAKAVKIHGFVTSVHSPTEFEIDDYRITKDASVVLELMKSEDKEEATAFDASGIRVGTEMEIRGDYDAASGQLTAKSIKVHLDENRRLKRTALLQKAPELHKKGSGWDGHIHVDGQRIVVAEETVVTIKLNNSQKKAEKAAQKAVTKAKKASTPADPETDEEEQPGAVLDRVEQIPPNTFVSYEGTRQVDGTVLARKLEFQQNELTSGEARMWKASKPKVRASNYAAGKPGDLMMQGIGKFKLVPDENVQKYVQKLGMALVPQLQRDLAAGDPQKIPFQFFVVEQKAINAFALPNGTVVVNSGILTTLENEAQLAAVLSHEITHAFEEHAYRQSQYHKNLRTAILIGGAIGAAYGGKAVGDIAKLTEAAVRNGYSRSLENQADRIGMERMMEAGYDPREAVRVWKVFSLKEGDHPTDFFWSSHDNNTTRRSYLMAELKNNYSGVDFENYTRDSKEYSEVAGAVKARYAPKTRKVKVKY